MIDLTSRLDRPLRVAGRVNEIKPFQAMEMLKAAADLARGGRDVISMSIGEPDFTAPEPVKAAAIEAIQRGATQYTDALGLPALREAIAGYYANTFGVEVDPGRIVVTAGASAALLLACAVLVDIGDEVLMPDPCYPCNRQFVSAFGGSPVLVPSGADTRFQLDGNHVDGLWGERTRGIMVSSPSNPTGTSMTRNQLDGLLSVVKKREGFAIVDEIYQGLSYDTDPITALASDSNAISVNSFSKYFSMTGWRLGWLVAPTDLIPALERVAQNLYICAPAIAQHAALACFSTESLAIYEARRLEFKRRRDLIVPALRSLGFDIPLTPDGAFYVYANCSKVAHPGSENSSTLARALLDEAGIAVVPGNDFGYANAEQHVRFSYATPYERLEQAIERLTGFLRA